MTCARTCSPELQLSTTGGIPVKVPIHVDDSAKNGGLSKQGSSRIGLVSHEGVSEPDNW